MKTDSEIKRDVEAELAFRPDIDAQDIAVKVNRGVAALTGFVNTYFEKYRAEAAAKTVAGVVGVADDIEVRATATGEADDPAIARTAVAALQSTLPVAAPAIKVLVTDGHVTLEGKVEWHYQRERAEEAVRYLKGVRSLNNQIRIEPRVQPQDIRRRIEEAFRRSAEVDAQAISVRAEGGKVFLSGRVQSWAERTQAQTTAWAAPGVTSVQNDISIGV